MFSRRDEYTEAELPAQLIIDTVLCSNPILKVPLPLFHFFYLSPFFFFFNRASCVEKYVSCNPSERRFCFPPLSFLLTPLLLLVSLPSASTCWNASARRMWCRSRDVKCPEKKKNKEKKPQEVVTVALSPF